jgi:hypothetical protein
MFGEEFDFPFQSLNQTIPFYFDNKILFVFFSTCRKSETLFTVNDLILWMLEGKRTLYLDDSDLDLNSHTLRVREEKCGRDGHLLGGMRSNDSVNFIRIAVSFSTAFLNLDILTLLCIIGELDWKRVISNNDSYNPRIGGWIFLHYCCQQAH